MVHILVADDSKDVAELMSEMLGREGHTVELAYDGQQVIDRIKGGEVFDIIVTDLLMPGVDGVGVLRFLQDQGNATPVLVLSGGGLTVNAENALKVVKNMADDVLAKPVKYEELLQKIDALVKSRT